MPRTNKKTPSRQKRATIEVPILQAAPPMRRRVPRVEQPLDPPEFEGSALAGIREKWSRTGSLLPDAAESDKLLTAYRSAHARLEAVREDLAAAVEKEGAAIVALATAFGGNSLRIDGVVHDFACRGETIFFRRKNVKIIDP